MYIAYGWPQHKVRLGKYKRDSCSIQREGENIQAVWSPDTKLIAVLTTSLYLHIFKVQFTDKRLHVGGKQPSTLSLVNINLLPNEQVLFPDKDITVSNIVCDNKHLLIGLSNGSLYSISWKGEFYGAFDIKSHPGDNNDILKVSHIFENGTPPVRSSEVCPSGPIVSRSSAIVWLEFSLMLRVLFVIFSDGQLMMCSVSKRGFKQVETIKAEKLLGSGDAACVAVASHQQVIAVGT